MKAIEKYRPCVGIVLQNNQGKIFVGQRFDMVTEAWQMPQGGIDDGENIESALYRELEEETGVTKNLVDIKMTNDEWLYYDLPENLAKDFWGGNFVGQRQKWFLLRFLGEDKDININTEIPEFRKWMWTDASRVVRHAIDFKRDIYKKVIASFSLNINDSK